MRAWYRKPHVSKSRSSRNLQSADASSAAAWSRSPQLEPVQGNQAAAVTDSGKEPGPAITIGAGTVHAAPQQTRADAAPSDGKEQQVLNPSQPLIEELVDHDKNSDSTAVSQLQHHQSSAGHVTASTSLDQTVSPVRNIMSNGSLHQQSQSARRLFQLAEDASELAHGTDNRLGMSDPLRLPLAADESSRRPLLDSSKPKPDKVWFWTRLWSSLRGRAHLLSCC